jgi:hypothetical protein
MIFSVPPMEQRKEGMTYLDNSGKKYIVIDKHGNSVEYTKSLFDKFSHQTRAIEAERQGYSTEEIATEFIKQVLNGTMKKEDLFKINFNF